MEQPASMAEILQQGEEIAEAHLGDRWNEIRETVFEEMQRPEWLAEVQGEPLTGDAGAAVHLDHGDVGQPGAGKAQSGEMRRQAITMSGPSARPAAQSPDEAYRNRAKEAGRHGYGS